MKYIYYKYLDILTVDVSSSPFLQDKEATYWYEQKDFEEYLKWCKIEDEIKYQKEKEEYEEEMI